MKNKNSQKRFRVLDEKFTKNNKAMTTEELVEYCRLLLENHQT